MTDRSAMTVVATRSTSTGVAAEKRRQILHRRQAELEQSGDIRAARMLAIAANKKNSGAFRGPENSHESKENNGRLLAQKMQEAQKEERRSQILSYARHFVDDIATCTNTMNEMDNSLLSYSQISHSEDRAFSRLEYSDDEDPSSLRRKLSFDSSGAGSSEGESSFLFLSSCDSYQSEDSSHSFTSEFDSEFDEKKGCRLAVFTEAIEEGWGVSIEKDSPPSPKTPLTSVLSPAQSSLDSPPSALIAATVSIEMEAPSMSQDEPLDISHFLEIKEGKLSEKEKRPKRCTKCLHCWICLLVTSALICFIVAVLLLYHQLGSPLWKTRNSAIATKPAIDGFPGPQRNNNPGPMRQADNIFVKGSD